MSPTSYLTAPPRDRFCNLSINISLVKKKITLNSNLNFDDFLAGTACDEPLGLELGAERLSRVVTGPTGKKM